jgi:hypothetical protein
MATDAELTAACQAVHALNIQEAHAGKRVSLRDEINAALDAAQAVREDDAHEPFIAPLPEGYMRKGGQNAAPVGPRPPPPPAFHPVHKPDQVGELSDPADYPAKKES